MDMEDLTIVEMKRLKDTLDATHGNEVERFAAVANTFLKLLLTKALAHAERNRA